MDPADIRDDRAAETGRSFFVERGSIDNHQQADRRPAGMEYLLQYSPLMEDCRSFCARSSAAGLWWCRLRGKRRENFLWERARPE
jgi:hypothetical protein